MTADRSLTPTDARYLLLAAQGLLTPPERPAGKADVLSAIRRMGALQIDTINVVARSPYLVLFSRLGDYECAWLDELEAEGQLFEYWSHAACFLPIEDYPLYRYRMDKEAQRYYQPDWAERHKETVEAVLQRIREQGPVRSSDFERTDGKKGTWWDWKVEKQVLEYLHTTGDLMIVHRHNFQRIYDLRERVLPDWNDACALAPEDARDELTVRSLRELGAAPARWVADYFRLPKQGMPARLKRLAEAGRLLPIQIIDADGQLAAAGLPPSDPWYIHPENLSLLEQARCGQLTPSYTTLLSPFDPLTWDRDRARGLFNFDYTIECYTPEAKRRYGYFSLPILHNGQLVGRLDAKAHRKEGIFEVRVLHLEPWVTPDAGLAQALRQAIQRSADWHGTPRVEIRRTEPPAFLEHISD